MGDGRTDGSRAVSEGVHEVEEERRLHLHVFGLDVADLDALRDLVVEVRERERRAGHRATLVGEEATARDGDAFLELDAERGASVGERVDDVRVSGGGVRLDRALEAVGGDERVDELLRILFEGLDRVVGIREVVEQPGVVHADGVLADDRRAQLGVLLERARGADADDVDLAPLLLEGLLLQVDLVAGNDLVQHDLEGGLPHARGGDAHSARLAVDRLGHARDGAEATVADVELDLVEVGGSDDGDTLRVADDEDVVGKHVGGDGQVVDDAAVTGGGEGGGGELRVGHGEGNGEGKPEKIKNLSSLSRIFLRNFKHFSPIF